MVAEVPAAGRRWFCVCDGAGGVVMETKVSGEEGQGVATEVEMPATMRKCVGKVMKIVL
jgi:hypothetical protein